ncbi:MAG: hypothetical protein ABIZ09_01630 [Rhodoferax sp.]|jgi:hypothetical protein
MTKTRLFFIYLLVLMGGCAVSPEKQVAVDSKPVCVREYRIGSNIPVLTCEARKTEAERQQMIDEVRNNAHTMPQRISTGGTGG